MNRSSHSNTLTGWREWVALPELDVDWMKAKIDTGARTSSLHAFDLTEFTRDGEGWVRFAVHPWQESREDAVVHECRVHDRRVVRSSSGHAEDRLVVRLQLRLVGQVVTGEVTLTNRDEMGFRMLIGREVLRQGFTVDPARSFLGGRAPRETRRRNRGRV
ncbi:MAG: ATP-dependent zinc protease [Microbacterium sp.]